MTMRRFQAHPTDQAVNGSTATEAGYIGRSSGGTGPTKACALLWDDTKTESDIIAAVDRIIAYLAGEARESAGTLLP